MKKTISIIFAAIILMLSLSIIQLPYAKKDIVSATDLYLRSPKNLAVIEDNIVFVYDGGIKAYRLNENNESNSPVSTTDKNIDILDMKTNGEEVYILQQENNIPSISRLELTVQNQIKITKIESSLSIDGAQKFAFYDNEFYIMLAERQIECMIRNGDELNYQKTITWSHLGFSRNEEIQDIALSEDKLYLMNENKISRISRRENAPYSPEEIFNSQDELKSLIFMEGQIATNSSDKIYTINESTLTKTDSTVDTTKNSITNITIKNSLLFYSDENNHQILLLDTLTKNSKICISNYTITPTIFGTSSVKIGRLNTSSLLQILPYTTSDSEEFAEKTEVIILSEDSQFSNHYYVLLSNNKINRYGYITKTSIDLIEKSQDNTILMTFADSTKVYKYPSIVNDEINTTITNLPKNVKITRTKILNYATLNGNSFSEVKLSDGTIGYIENSRLTAPVVAKTKTITANAKIKNSTTLYADENGKDVLIEVPVGTRVFLEEKLNRNKKYTKITLNLASGEEVSGYVLTVTINPDSLTSMQILGIALVAVNIVFLVVIMLIRKRLTNT